MSRRMCEREELFGGRRGWDANDWIASDDRVRGGRSQSYLRISGTTAEFCGTLDFDTLGGAGFASQRTTGDNRLWDLSKADGIELVVDASKSDNKRYTFILKDEILPRNPENGREMSTTSWEYEFDVGRGPDGRTLSGMQSVVVPWMELKPTYRGKERDPGRPPKLTEIRRISIMMRSYFGNQQGDFSLTLASIAAVSIDRGTESIDPDSRVSSSDSDSDSGKDTELVYSNISKRQPRNLWTRLFGSCCRL